MASLTMTQQKVVARKAAFARRKAAFDAQLPGAAGKLSEVLAGYRSVPLAGYLPIKTELDPRPAMAEAAAYGVVSVPIVIGDGQPLKFAVWEPDMALQKAEFGVEIPAKLNFVTPEVIVIPLVAFTPQGMRLGYGGGFYDRTLAALRQERPVLAIGFAFDEQETADLPLEDTDQPLDMIVTQSRVLSFSRLSR